MMLFTDYISSIEQDAIDLLHAIYFSEEDRLANKLVAEYLLEAVERLRPYEDHIT